MNSIATPVSPKPAVRSGPLHSGHVHTGAVEFVHVAGRAGRLAAYLELAKPRIAIMVLVAVSVGYLLASQGNWNPWPLGHACLGILLAVVASSALNQILERKTDSLMPRTQGRPLPSARLKTSEVVIFALLCSAISFVYLLLTVNTLTAFLTLTTTVLYAGCYTPLKRHSALCTVVGAVPGALPPVLGWAAAGNGLDLGAFSLFAILFIWQFPHFLAIGWIYQDQYRDAGLKMLPGNGMPGIVGVISTGYALVLIPISLLPAKIGLTGQLYPLIALIMGGAYLWSAVCFQRNESRKNARMVVWVSLVYLPIILAALAFDHLRLLQ